MSKESLERRNSHLVPFNSETAKIASEKGRLARAEKARSRKELKEALKIVLNLTIKKKGKIVDTEKIQSLAEANGQNITVNEALAIALTEKALSGDVQAFITIRDTIGEKPTDKVELDESKTIESWAKNHKVKV
ncbi:MAG: hypothetical protein KBT35_01295 [Firmicutes bacterium]|nr:hypothetical protein [Candidatus Colivicinus equi]